MTDTLTPPARPAGRKLQRRGEESRRKILDATLVLIAKRGLHGVTHRAIAAEAEVPLSLTTYFFSGLSDLIAQTFDHFVAVAANDNMEILHRLAMFLDGFPAEDLLQNPAIRLQVRNVVASQLANFIREQASVNSVGLAVELNFLSLYRLEAPIRAKVMAYRGSLVAGIAELARRMGSSQPETDASLVLAVIHRLQFECMNLPPPWPETLLEAEIGRMLTLVLRLPDAAPLHV
ncbi:TetR/AcrR family transcriptional regulator [Chitinimonas sp. BJYL2]|uniref:TetR/AcrR family transcriptional regulator n=1 Tax=Chitinimonas sp. BJYL2 TaxID=2976696 RepID=UPI0022B4DA96|nr:TetR family transcriptional regulator [Chitinimonas sp. BJYL2]